MRFRNMSITESRKHLGIYPSLRQAVTSEARSPAITEEPDLRC